MSMKVACGSDIQEYLAQGMEYVASCWEDPKRTELEAVVKLLRMAELVILVMPGEEK